MVKRRLFAVIQSGKFVEKKTKTDFCAKYLISSRQFNAIHDEVKGLIQSNLSNKKNYIADSKIRIKVQKETLCKIRKQKPKNIEKLKKKQQTIRAKEQKLQRVERKLERLQEDVKAKRVQVAFGTKKLFHTQFHPKENRYESHEEWKIDWDYARNNQFFLVGSHDEPWGNQNCQITENEDKSFNLSLRLPDKLVTPGIPKRVCFENIRFSYGYDEISAAVQENKERKAIPVKNKEERKSAVRRLDSDSKRASKGPGRFS